MCALATIVPVAKKVFETIACVTFAKLTQAKPYLGVTAPERPIGISHYKKCIVERQVPISNTKMQAGASESISHYKNAGRSSKLAKVLVSQAMQARKARQTRQATQAR